MSIKENTLPVAISLQKGDKVRIVNKDGESKQIDAGAIGGGGMFVVTIYSEFDPSAMKNTYTADKTVEEINAACYENHLVVCKFGDYIGYLTELSASARFRYGGNNRIYDLVINSEGVVSQIEYTLTAIN